MVVTLDDLTGPGALFPLTERIVHGVPMLAYDRDPRTLRDVFLATRRFGERTALVYQDQRWSFTAQWSTVNALAWALRERFGVERGDRVAIAMRNYPEWCFIFWAAQLLGAVVVPLNAWLTGEELNELIAHSEPKLLFADQERLDRLTTSPPGFAVEALIGIRTRAHADVVPFDDLVAPDAREAPECVLGADDVATILYTSGTTGRPKGVVATHFAHTASLLNRHIRVVAAASNACGELHEPRPEDQPTKAKLMTYPLFHIAGVGTLSAAAFNAHTLVMMYKWDVDEAVRIVGREGISELTGPPLIGQTIVEAAREHPDALRSLNLLGTGGASLPARMLADIRDVFEGRVSPTTGYGLTETTGGVIAISGAEFTANPDSIGRPLPTISAKVVDEAGGEVSPGGAGELAIRAPQLMSHYYRDEDATRAAIVDGWFLTGDMATIADDGLVRLVGRLKDLVIRGGENINCGQVESCIGEHPAVAEVAVIGTPHPTLGEEPVAVVRLNEGHRLDGDAIRRFVAARLAAFKVPAHVVFVDAPLPRTASGKLLKREISVTPDMLRRAVARTAS